MKVESSSLPASFTPHSAFTLVEVILAIGIATGLLLVALTFYNQAADMRNQVLRESQRASTMRLVLDRLAGDLRSAQPLARPGNEFTGDSNSMFFVKEVCTSVSADPRLRPSSLSDLVRISIIAVYATNENRLSVGGLDRSEGPLTPPVASDLTATNLAASALLATNSDVAVLPSLDQTNVAPAEIFADIIRFVRFRYWDGSGWQLTWTNAAPPPGIELVLSTVDVAEDAPPDSYPAEAFRRVVFLPAGVPSLASGLESTNAAAPSETQ